jgi:tetratricopeptide (TPR) repeat protein
MLEQGQAHETRGEISKAFTAYSASIALDDESPWGYVAYARLLGIPATVSNGTPLSSSRVLRYEVRSKEDLDEILNYLTRAIHTTSSDPTSCKWRADALRTRAKFVVLAKKDLDDEAIADLSAAIALEPGNGDSYSDRAEVHARANDQAQALADFTKAIACAPDNAFFHFRRGLFYWKSTDEQKAMADFDRAIELEPKNALFYLARGDSHATQGHFEQAIVDYSRCLALDPANAEAHTSRGTAYGELGDRQRALTDFADAIRLDPKSAEAYYARGLCYASSSDDLRALDDLDRAIVLDPDHALAHCDRGIIHARHGELRLAIDDFSTSIALSPAKSEFHCRRAIAYVDRGLLGHAIDDLSAAHRLDPKRVDVLVVRAAVEIEQQLESSALVDLDRAEQLDDLRGIIAALRIKAHTRLGYGDLATAARERALKGDPDSVPQLLLAAMIDAGADRDHRAMMAYNARLQPLGLGEHNIALLRSALLIEAAQYSDAKRLLQHLLVEHSDLSLAHLLLGEALLADHDMDRALASFNRAIQLEPNRAMGYYCRGRAFAAQGDWANAINGFSRALTLLDAKPELPKSQVWSVHSGHSPYSISLDLLNDHPTTAPNERRGHLGPVQYSLSASVVCFARAKAHYDAGQIDQSGLDIVRGWARQPLSNQVASLVGVAKLSRGPVVEGVVVLLRIRP